MSVIVATHADNRICWVVPVDNADTFREDAAIVSNGQVIMAGPSETVEIHDPPEEPPISRNIYRYYDLANYKYCRIDPSGYTRDELDTMYKDEIQELADVYGLTSVTSDDLKSAMIDDFLAEVQNA